MIKKVYSKRKQAWVWKLDIYVKNGAKKRRARVAVFETRRQAEEALAIIRRREKEEQFGLAPQIDRPRLADLIARRLERIENRLERGRATRVFNTWLKQLPAEIAVDDVTTSHLQLYVDLRQTEGQAAASINRELNILAAMLNSAADHFVELRNWRPPKIPRPRGIKSRRERLITNDEYQRLQEWLRRPPDERDAARRQNQRNAYEARLRVAAILTFALNTGMRSKEIYGLQWADIDWDGQRIRIRDTKTDKTRYVPLSAPALETLKEQSKYQNEREFIFTKGGGPTPKLYRVLRDACEAVGIPYGRKVKNGLVLYDSRHTFTTRLLQSGLDLRVVGDATGHSDKEMVLHYSHVNAESAARTRAAIEDIQRKRLRGAAEEKEDQDLMEFLTWLRAQLTQGGPVTIESRYLPALRKLAAHKEKKPR